MRRQPALARVVADELVRLLDRSWFDHAHDHDRRARRRDAWRVGDVMEVTRASAVNPPRARAVIVEVYRLEGRPGWALLFEDGQHDGFSPADCDLFVVKRIGHEPTVADYVFHSALRLLTDWRAGRFAAVWSETKP